MEHWKENITNRISKIPMAMVITPFAAGIFFADNILLPIWLLLLATIVSLAGVILLSKWWQSIATIVMIFSIGTLLHSLSHSDVVLYNTPLDMLLRVESSSSEHNGYTSAKARVLACEDSRISGRRLVVWGDSLTKFRANDRIRLSTPIRAFKAQHKQYAELMHHRDFIGSISVTHRSNYEYIPAANISLHDWAVSRLQEAIPKSLARGVVLAMVTGERSEITNELRQSYSASGTSHLLAVSGLHIGIAFMLINCLLLPLVLLRYGNVWRSVVAVALIWLYVWLCGMSPSAVRAAIMFSLLQFSLSSMHEYSSINILAGTAFIMLAFNSHLLFDTSFQLSFIAVAGIILWAIPLYRVCATRFKILNSIIGVLLVGVASTIATAPLVANTFSVVSPIGIFINPIVIAIANVLIFAGVIAIGIPFVAPIAEYAAALQNHIIEYAATVPYGHFKVPLSETAMWGIYTLFIVISLMVWLYPRGKRVYEIKE